MAEKEIDMKITKDNIHELKIGDKIWIPQAFRIPESYVYLGVFKNDPFGERYGFISTGSGGGFSVNMQHADSDDDVNKGNIFTTYEEACERLRVLSLNIIDHYNNHQLKSNPISISREDEQYLWRNRKVE